MAIDKEAPHKAEELLEHEAEVDDSSAPTMASLSALADLAAKASGYTKEEAVERVEEWIPIGTGEFEVLRTIPVDWY